MEGDVDVLGVAVEAHGAAPGRVAACRNLDFIFAGHLVEFQRARGVAVHPLVVDEYVGVGRRRDNRGRADVGEAEAEVAGAVLADDDRGFLVAVAFLHHLDRVLAYEEAVVGERCEAGLASVDDYRGAGGRRDHFQRAVDGLGAFERQGQLAVLFDVKLGHGGAVAVLAHLGLVMPGLEPSFP